MRPRVIRERNPYHQDPRDRRVGAPWGVREGDELGYQRAYGEYGSNARGWADRPHARHWAHRDNYTETYEDYSGIAPKGYQRPDEIILEHIADRLTWSPAVDATEISISVKDGNVVVAGTVPERSMIYIVDELVESVRGVKDFENHLKVQRNF